MKLTVIIRNNAPLLYLGEPLQYRTIHIDLTWEQLKQLVLEKDEEISQTFIEK